MFKKKVSALPNLYHDVQGWPYLLAWSKQSNSWHCVHANKKVFLMKYYMIVVHFDTLEFFNKTSSTQWYIQQNNLKEGHHFARTFIDTKWYACKTCMVWILHYQKLHLFGRYDIPKYWGFVVYITDFGDQVPPAATQH